jgi:hypothetical protein
MTQDTTDPSGVSPHATPQSGIPHNGTPQSGLAPTASSHSHASVPANALIHLSHGSVPGLGANALGANKHIEPLIARMEADLAAARVRGIWGVMRLRYEAWLEEKMRGPAVAKMQTRQAVLAEQCRTAEAEIRLRATVQSGEVGAQRHKIEWNDVNRHRLAGELQSLGLITLPTGDAPLAVPSPLSGYPQSPLSPHVTSEQVEAVALRGFLQGVESEEDWGRFREELGRHLSPYAVEEVGQRLRELWRLNRQAQAG